MLLCDDIELLDRGLLEEHTRVLSERFRERTRQTRLAPVGEARSPALVSALDAMENPRRTVRGEVAYGFRTARTQPSFLCLNMS